MPSKRPQQPSKGPSPYMTLHPSTSTLSLTPHHLKSHNEHHNTHEDDDQDLEDNDSETTLANEGFLSKRANIASKSARLSSILTWIRFSIVVFLQGIIIILLLPTTGLMEAGWGMGFGVGSTGSNGTGVVQPGVVRIDESKSGMWTPGKTETGGDVNGLYVPTAHTYTLLATQESKFVPNMSTNDDRMAIRHNWDMLMPLGSGSVSIPDYAQYPMLGKPISDDPIRSGPLFEASWTHALHCLYYTVDTYHQLVLSTSSNNTTANPVFGFDGERNDMHAGHCFEYLRNQILCMADMTLEGSESVLDATGEGQPHMCRDRSEAIKWIEERRVDDLQSIVGP